MDVNIIYLQELPFSTAVEVAKKLRTSEFIKTMRTCKWMKNMVEARRHTFVKDALNMDLAIYPKDVREKDDETIKERFGSLAHFKLNVVSISEFDNDIPEIKRLLALLRECRIYMDYLHLDKTVALAEMFAYFRPTQFSVNVYRYQTCQIANEVFPPSGMDSIRVQLSQEAAMQQVHRFLIGRSRELSITSHLEFKLAAMKQLMETVAERGHNQEINILLTKPFIRVGPQTFDQPFREADFGMDHRVFSIARQNRTAAFHLFVLRGPAGAVFTALEGKEESDDLFEPVFCIHAASLAEFKTRFIDNFKFFKYNLVNRLMVTSFVTQYFR